MKFSALAILVACALFVLNPVRAVAGWGHLGSGMDSDVYALATFNGQLFSGGAFTHADGVPANAIAMWDGTSWRPVGSGVQGEGESRVFAMVVYEGALIVAGRFDRAGSASASNIASWDGSAWSPLGVGVDGDVYALGVYNGHLIAGGSFFHAGGNEAVCIAQWDGTSWSPLGAGFECRECGNALGVLAFGVHGGSLVAGGWFDYVDGVPASYIASWSGSWGPLGSGMDYPVSALSEYNGELIAGGAFSEAGGRQATGIAGWDGSSWNPLGDGVVGWYNWVRALALYGGELIAGGYFTEAGGAPANHIAGWDGSSWRTLEEGTDGEVEALTVFDSLLVVGGSFDTAGGAVAHKVAYWYGQPTGACCLNSYCVVMTRLDCTRYQGSYQGDGVPCDPNTCATSAVKDGSGAFSRLALSAAPNPTAGACLLLYQLPTPSVVTIDVFDAGGVLVRSFMEGLQLAGRHSLRWDGRAGPRNTLPSGLYVARIRAGSETAAARLLLVK